jgi:GT2 family glycosyltransferase
MSAMSKRLNITVGIATVGRREILSSTIEVLSRQTRLPDSLVICPGSSDDVDVGCLSRFPSPTCVVSGSRGLPAQRNAILAATRESDIIVFFDDDFFAEKTYLEILERVFLEHEDVAATTGVVLADGITGPGIGVAQGLEILRSYRASSNESRMTSCYGTYGCNMAFRVPPIDTHRLRFDENLPLYGWQEDVDFSLRIAPFGRIVKVPALRGVHLGIKTGRVSGVRFGYSQIANPVYLIRKGSISSKHAWNLMCRNLAANCLRSLHPEPWIDRKGRLKGNIMALLDVVRGRSSPSRILSLD